VECRRPLLRKDDRAEADNYSEQCRSSDNEANTTAENVQYYNIKDFKTHSLFKARQIASGMLVAVKKI